MTDERSSSSMLGKTISEPQTGSLSPRMGLRDRFYVDRARRTFIYHVKISPSFHTSKIYISNLTTIDLFFEWIGIKK